jgi:uncharacterized membrane protein
MNAGEVAGLVFRYLHVIAAALAIGGVFFMRVILPAGTAGLDEAGREQVFLGARRKFKIVVHTCVLLLLASGIFNSIKLFPQYNAKPGLLHGLWGMHILIGVLVMAISLWLLAGQKPPASHRKWGMVNVMLMLLLVLLASSVKQVREKFNQRPAAPEAAAEATTQRTP